MVREQKQPIRGQFGCLESSFEADLLNIYVKFGEQHTENDKIRQVIQLFFVLLHQVVSLTIRVFNKCKIKIHVQRQHAKHS